MEAQKANNEKLRVRRQQDSSSEGKTMGRIGKRRNMKSESNACRRKSRMRGYRDALIKGLKSRQESPEKSVQESNRNLETRCADEKRGRRSLGVNCGSGSFFRPISTSPLRQEHQSSQQRRSHSWSGKEEEKKWHDYDRELDLITTFGNPRREFEVREREGRVAVVEVTRRVVEVFYRGEFAGQERVSFLSCQKLMRRREEKRKAFRNECQRLRAIYDAYLRAPEDEELVDEKKRELEQTTVWDPSKVDNFRRLLFNCAWLKEEPPYKPEQEAKDGIEELCHELRAWWLE